MSANSFAFSNSSHAFNARIANVSSRYAKSGLLYISIAAIIADSALLSSLMDRATGAIEQISFLSRSIFDHLTISFFQASCTYYDISMPEVFV